MLERDLLLNATAAILLACLAWLHPAVSRRFGLRGFVLVVVGTFLPFLDTALFHLTTTDRIDLLSHPPLFAAPVTGLALIAVVAGLVAQAAPPGRVRPVAVRIALALGTGFVAHIALSVLTPVGWPLLEPFRHGRISLPVLPAGYAPLLVVLFGGVAAAEGLPRWRRWIAPSAAALAGVCVLAGAVQYGVIAVRAQGLAEPQDQVFVYPDDAWLTRWQVVLEGPERYALYRERVVPQKAPEPRVLPRWNDQALFLKLLGDPVVNRFYFRVFDHPVVRLDVSGSQITLLMQELRDQSPLVPGPTFYLESDRTGRNRFYQLQRFD